MNALPTMHVCAVYILVIMMFVISNVSNNRCRSASSDSLRFVAVFGGGGDKIAVHLDAVGHRETPLVLDLSAQVQVHLGHQQTVAGSRQTRGSAGVRGRHIGRTVEVAEVVLGCTSVTRGEGVRVGLCAHTVDAHREIVVGNRCVSRLDTPHGLREPAHGRRRVEHYLRPIHSLHEPVQWVVTAIANVDADSTERGLKHGVSQVALHVIGGFVEVTDTRDVVLVVSAHDSSVIDDDSRVEDGLLGLVSLEDR